MYKNLKENIGFSRFEEVGMRLGGQEIVLGGWLDVVWGVGAVFWRLVAGFGRPGVPQGDITRGIPWFWRRFVGRLGGGRWGV